MCKKETYKRFNKIYEYMKNNGEYGIDDHIYAYAYIFKTKMGDRCVEIIRTTKDVDLISKHDFIFLYFDYDDEKLFQLLIKPNGKITVIQKKDNVDEVAIFSAIYELECLIYNKKYQERENILEKLFEYNTLNMGYGNGFTSNFFK